MIYKVEIKRYTLHRCGETKVIDSYSFWRKKDADNKFNRLSYNSGPIYTLSMYKLGFRGYNNILTEYSE